MLLIEAEADIAVCALFRGFIFGNTGRNAVKPLLDNLFDNLFINAENDVLLFQFFLNHLNGCFFSAVYGRVNSKVYAFSARVHGQINSAVNNGGYLFILGISVVLCVFAVIIYIFSHKNTCLSKTVCFSYFLQNADDLVQRASLCSDNSRKLLVRLGEVGYHNRFAARRRC